MSKLMSDTSNDIFNILKQKDMIGKEISGIDFNSMFPDINFIKLTNANENHNNFQFHDGLNIDTIPFNPKGSCSEGGIYFTTEEDSWEWVRYDDKMNIYMRKVVIPDDARVYIEDGKFKADKIILGTRKMISKDMYVKYVKAYSLCGSNPYEWESNEIY